MREKFLLKKRVLFLALLTMIGVFAIQAQTWNAPSPEGTTIVSATGYYVYNEGAKAFLDRGGEWATQAIVFPSNGALVTVTAVDVLWTLHFEATNRSLFRANAADGWVYTDNSTENTWNIVLADAVNNLYTIQAPAAYVSYNADQYLGASATKYSSNSGVVSDVRYNRAASDYTKWKFCTAASVEKYNAQVKLDSYMKVAKLIGSAVDLTTYINTYNTGTAAEILTAATTLYTALAPEDKTSLITNAAFDVSPVTGWTTTASFGYNFTEVEYYGRSYDVNQTVTGLPAGVYTLKAQGYERPGALSATTQTWFVNGWDGRSAKVYATVAETTTSVPLKSIFSETASTTGNLINGFTYPNSMSNAFDAMTTAGLYDNELTYFVVDATGTAKIGVNGSYRSNGGWTMGQWVLFDNFRLYYYGALAIPNLSVSESALFISNAVSLTKTFNVTGANLTGDITITAPAGITLTGTNLVNNGGGSYTIAQANANVVTTITATWNEVDHLTGTIAVSSADVTTKNISVSTSKDAGCFTPLYTDKTNIITDPFIHDLSFFGGWGVKAIVTDPALVYCGASCASVGDGVSNGGSLDFALTGKIEPSKSYRVKAMVKTIGGDFQMGLFGWSDGQPEINNIINTNGEWQILTFDVTTGTSLGGTQGMFWNNYQRSGTLGYIDNWEMYEIPVSTSLINIHAFEGSKVYFNGNSIVVDFVLAQASEVEISVFNAQGMLLKRSTGSFNAGQNNQVVDANLNSGLYLVKLTQNGKTFTAKVIK